jgi:hypothetical protein
VALQEAVRKMNENWENVIPARLDAQCGYCGKSVAMERIGPVVEHRKERIAQKWVTDLNATYLCAREKCFLASIAVFRFAQRGFTPSSLMART